MDFRDSYIRIWNSIFIIVSFVFYFSFSGDASGQSQGGLTSDQEYRNKISKSMSLGGQGADKAFGENISLYDGGTLFYIEDISIPGSFDLPVRLARSFDVVPGNRGRGNGIPKIIDGLDDWEVDIPYISGVWTKDIGWSSESGGIVGGLFVSQPTLQRCSVTNPLVSTYSVGNGITVSWGGGMQESLLIASNPSYMSADSGISYPWVTESKAIFSCLAKTKNGYPGEAFVAQTVDGKKYYFDWGIEKPYPYYIGSNNRPAAGKLVSLMLSHVEDRYGNWVNYVYTGSRVSQIVSSDGRSIAMSYDSSGNLLIGAANGKIWAYTYTRSGDDDGGLSQVVLPDGTRWSYAKSGALHSRAAAPPREDVSICDSIYGSAGLPFSYSITSPSGAVGKFSFAIKSIKRNNDGPCTGVQPYYYDSWALQERIVTGSGMSQQKTTYDLGQTNSTSERWVTETQPDGSKHMELYGANPLLNERRILATKDISSTGVILKSVAYSYIQGGGGQPFPERLGSTILGVGYNPQSGIFAPVSSTSIQMDGASFSSSTTRFDSFARPVEIKVVGLSEN